MDPAKQKFRTEIMVRKGGFEPPRLSAPPPQDGVSASSTTSAIDPILMLSCPADSCNVQANLPQDRKILHLDRRAAKDENSPAGEDPRAAPLSRLLFTRPQI